MKNLFSILFILSIFISACSNSNNNHQSSNDSQTEDTTQYKTIKTTKVYSTNSDGSVKETLLNASVFYSDKEIKINFQGDSTWTFEVKEKTEKKEGITFLLIDKKYKEMFISSGSLPLITLTTHTETSNITLM
ncbi:MAG: hypothetical protein HPY79_01775 [Bacteroidales bacterium]|nr:hypothetical protein [Bacteroidales bacterium]